MGKVFRHFWKRGVVICILSAVIVIGISSPVEAYVFNGWKLSNPKDVKYYVGNAASSFYNEIEEYAVKWEIYCSEISMSENSNYNIYFYADFTNTGAYATTFHISDDVHTITFYQPFGAADSSVRSEVIVHEVGHALGLAHCEAVNNSISVMRELGFNGKAYLLSDDRAGISALY